MTADRIIKGVHAFVWVVSSGLVIAGVVGLVTQKPLAGAAYIVLGLAVTAIVEIGSRLPDVVE